MLSKVFTPSSNASEKRERETKELQKFAVSEVMCDECDVKTTGQPTGAEGQMVHTRTDGSERLLLRHGRFLYIYI